MTVNEHEGVAEGAYRRLLDRLDAGQARYRVMEHEPEGRTEVVSAYRGHPVGQAAKCMIVMVKLDKRTTRYVLAVVPGDRRVDLDAVRSWLGGTYAGFAPAARAEALADTVSGAILPFADDPELTLGVDPGLLEHREMYFNAGRLDRSVALRTEDYVRLARPQIRPIAGPRPYVMDGAPLVGGLERLDVQEVIDGTTQPWVNRTLCRVDDAVLRLGVLQGEFHWHRHDAEDELFFVLDGTMRIELSDRPAVELGPRQMVLIPKGVLHRPVVPTRTAVLMIERAGVVPTGD